MAKTVLKKCTSCKFDKCWAQAKKCENCGFDFVLGRKPRTKTLADLYKDEPEDDDFVPVLPEKPKEVKKTCPDCKTEAWHAAPFCEKCGYNYKTCESKMHPPEGRRKKKDDDDEEEKIVLERRRGCGVKPIWSKIGHYPWMDDFAGPFSETDNWVADPKSQFGGKFVPNGDVDALKKWAHNFMRELRTLIQYVPFHSSCPVDYAEISPNPHLRAARGVLFDLYGVKNGITRWKGHADPRLMDGEYLTESEVADEYYKLKRT